MRTFKAILLVTLVGLCCTATALGQDISDRLQGYYKLNETSGSTAYDSSGNGNNGTYVSSPVLGNSGKFGTSVGFGSPTTTRLTLPGSILDNEDDITVSFWIRTTSSGLSTILSAANSSQSNEVWLYINNGVLNLRYDGGSSQTWNLNSINDGKWHHVAIVTDDYYNRTYAYQDGVYLGYRSLSPSGDLSVSSSGLIIGQDQDCLGGCFDSNQRLIGDLDELRIYDRALSSQEISILYGFIGHWKLDETFGSTAYDSSPVDNDGTYQNTPDLNEQGPYPGAGDNAVEFNGTNEYVSTPNESIYDISGALTVAVWLKVDEFDRDWQAIIAKGDSAWRLSRYGSGDTLHFACSGLSTDQVNGSVDVNDGQWHHVVGVYDESSLSLYVDGQLDATVSTSGSISTNDYNLYFAENAQSTDRYWDGWLHDVRVYARALSEEEIAELYGLVGRWKLDETSGTTAVDSSLMGQDGTYTNNVSLGESGPFSGTAAADFDGYNDYVNLPTYTTDFSTGYSIAVWGRPTTYSSWERFADFGRGQDLDNFFFGRQGTTSTLESTIHDGSLGWRSPITATNAIVNNAWHHYTVTVDSTGDAKLYVDGVQVQSTTIGVPSDVTRNSNYIARSNWTVDDYFDGKMYDMRLFNRALSAEEVDAIFSDSGFEGIRIIEWLEIP